MLRFAFILCSSLLLVNTVSAQSRLDGTWEGTMTVGGIYSNEMLPMQLYLKTKDRKVEGRSYVQLPDGSTLQMDLVGFLHYDQSISLTEVKFAGDPFNKIMPEFNRQYQILFKDDLWNPLLRGFWQEETSEAFLETRRRGRMQLTQRKVKGV